VKLLIIDNTNVHEAELMEKCKEEVEEIVCAMLNGDDEHTIAECFDLMQIAFSLMLKISKYDMDLLQKINNQHLEKLRGRNHKILGGITLI